MKCIFLCVILILVSNVNSFPYRPQIIDGTDADIAQHPWQVSIFLDDGNFNCGGALITPEWILTAGHCNLYKNYTTIRAGSNMTDSGGVTADVVEIIVHPNFDPFGRKDLSYDIALARLGTPISGENIGLIALPQVEQDLPDKTILNIAGWGQTNINVPEVYPYLQEVEVPTVDQKMCTEIYKRMNTTYETVTDTMFCASYLGVGGKSPCHGDSGGPAVLNGTAVGIVSWGRICASPIFPAVYTRVDRFIDWIHSHIDES